MQNKNQHSEKPINKKSLKQILVIGEKTLWRTMSLRKTSKAHINGN